MSARIPEVSERLRADLRRAIAQKIPWPQVDAGQAVGLLFDSELGLREVGIAVVSPVLTPGIAQQLIDLLDTPHVHSGAVQAVLLVLKNAPLAGEASAEWSTACRWVDEQVLAWMSADDPDVRYQALYVAEWRKFRGAVYGDRLCARLLDPDAEVRGLAAQALGRVGNVSHAALLSAALERARDHDERFHLLAALVAVGAKEGLCGRLLACLKRANLRFATIQLLGVLGDREAIPELRKIAGRWWSDPFERVAAAASLCEVGEADGEAQLKKCVGSRRVEVRGFALQQIARLNVSGGLGLLLAALERSKDPAAAIVPPLLVGRGEPEAAHALRVALTHPLAEVRDAARSALQSAPEQDPK